MKCALIALALAAALPLSAQASEQLKYSYVEADYISSDYFSTTFDGFALKGSVGFGNNWYANASYRNVDNGRIDVQLDETVVNLGYHHAVAPTADFIAEVGYVREGIDVDGFGSDSADGYRIAAGFRGMLASQFEGDIKGYYSDVNDAGDSEFGVEIGGVWHINQTWGLTASYDYTRLADEGINTWGLGVRASF